ncbi:hypothetical protein MVES_002244 [Malassezia vespertilionis]|uniref:Uncharacterized protein n=1 Tax=Malassezia vespertilionis TaxID=2020962 RepID=A0A2N1JBH8_9BASI|nr:hypothetical protein MVES_002244 [Malassezia vespertilionis]
MTAHTPIDAAGWESVVHAYASLDAVKDALFVIEEMRQDIAKLWATVQDGANGSARHAHHHTPTAAALDNAGVQLASAVKHAQCRVCEAVEAHADPVLEKERQRLLDVWTPIRLDADTAVASLQDGRLLLGLYNAYCQAHMLMDTLEAALAALRNETASEARAAFEAQRAHYVPASRQLLGVLESSAGRASRVCPEIRTYLDNVWTRWGILQHALSATELDKLAEHTQAAPIPTPLQTPPRRAASGPLRWSNMPPLPAMPGSAPRLPTNFTPSVQRDSPPRTPKSTGAPAPVLRRRGSMLPRRSMHTPEPALRAGTTERVRRYASCASLASLPRTRRAFEAYVPQRHDALDIGVARVCNAYNVPVERVDGAPGDECHRYILFSKT